MSDKTGQVVGVRQVEANAEVMLISQQGKLIRIPVDGVSVIGRSTQGVRMMDLGEDDHLVALAKIVEHHDPEEEDAGPDSGDPETSEDEPVN